MPISRDGPSRRAFFLYGGAAIVAIAGGGLMSRLAGAKTIAGRPGEVTIALFSDAGEPLGTKTMPKVVKTEEEWMEQLSDLAFRVTRQEGTERAFSGPYLDNHDKGLYRCVCCDTALYSSDTKFESGTGWPSFWQPIAKENILEIEDRTFGMLRTGISCARCDAHLGHVFNDGPQPTGLRYCMNGVALRFAAQSTA